MTTATGATIDYSYDGIKRLDGTTVKLQGESLALYTTAYAYKTRSDGKATTLVEFRNVKDSSGNVIDGYKYTYDAVGNIIQISEPLSPYNPLVKYVYDSQNQLLSETYYDGEGNTSSNITAVYTYTYDTAGNILTESVDGTVTKTYTYGNSTWRDLLTSVNGNTISYDAIGNPTTYYNGTLCSWDDPVTYYMTWSNGRQLTFLDYWGEGQLRINYSYDVDGIRTAKNVEGVQHDYVTQNGKVVRETITQGTTTRILDFIYDESGWPFAMRYSPNGGTTFGIYYYVLNLQGDVVKLITSGGTVIANYEYNAWGELLSVTNSAGTEITTATHVGLLNPLRYRGYYFDSETGFYYLQSRYYDPVTHRFINADSLASTGHGIVGTNMFAYCNNNPANQTDAIGLLPTNANDLFTMHVMDTENMQISMDWRMIYYDTFEEAAIVAGTVTNIATHTTNKEHACGIFQTSDGSYYIGTLYNGKHASIDVSGIPFDVAQSSDTMVAIVHSHPYCDRHNGEQFSIGFEFIDDSRYVMTKDYGVALYYQVPLLLGTPSGYLKVLIPTTYYSCTEEMIGQYLPVAKIKYPN